MQITNNTAVSFHYTLTNRDGEQLDSSRGEAPLVYLHGAGNIIAGLEAALAGKQTGDKFNVTIAPDQAYGEIQEEMKQVVSKTMFGDMEVEVGMQFHADVNYGSGVITVTEINGDDVTIDGNHPLAGEALTFDVEVVDVRPATADEMSHGHVHGAGCSH
ncbi:MULTISPECIES: peptidylprolyl isomerase [Methylomonas]|uniref:Peptidyl-prolyl cis-trans isomerase n=1 Tax=Methylomonas koyamae TaxID=702114 RepID=A0A177N2D1_9GAMM|nr:MULTISPECIES: peptidylprolyl isomerase [Methylomonas]OAI11329.1 peptidylprolyl isomerase [Methylomonas koyamae]OHX34355.1 peptidylprolyl isomerase [Methylomonas sp. LWB]WGS88172.1 peptidylprolyl isomerase [Methylomonas sp. UP202]